jgi:hydrogenase maturation protease
MAVEAGAPRHLLIGIGNPLRGDDGVGPALLEQLARELGSWRTACAELKSVHQLTPELALAVAGVRRVLFLDACSAPCTVEPWIERLDELLEGLTESSALVSVASNLGGHHLAPITLLALAQTLYGWQGEGALLRVPAFAFPHGSSFSAPLRRTLPQARELLQGWLQGDDQEA